MIEPFFDVADIFNAFDEAFVRNYFLLGRAAIF